MTTRHRPSTNDLPRLAATVLRKLRPIGFGPLSLSVLQPVGEPVLLLKAAAELPREAVLAVKREISRVAGTDVRVDLLNDAELSNADRVVAVKGGYRLALVPAWMSPQLQLTTLAKATQAPQRGAFPRPLGAAGNTPRVSFRLLKLDNAEPQPAWKRIVTGVILEPNVLDGTKAPLDPEVDPADPDPTIERTEGDIYDEATIEEAMYYWMENHLGAYAFHHTSQGGIPLGPEDVSLLENWQTRQEERHGDQIVRKGAWMQTNKIQRTPCGDALWTRILANEIQSWSIEGDALGQLEPITGPIRAAGEYPDH